MNAPLFLRISVALMDEMADPLQFSGLTPEGRERFQSGYTESELAGIRSGLDFALENPGYDFASLVPGIEYSNAEILAFLTKLHRSL